MVRVKPRRWERVIKEVNLCFMSRQPVWLYQDNAGNEESRVLASWHTCDVRKKYQVTPSINDAQKSDLTQHYSCRLRYCITFNAGSEVLEIWRSIPVGHFIGEDPLRLLSLGLLLILAADILSWGCCPTRPIRPFLR